MKCCVVGCNNAPRKESQKSLSMHRLPTNEVKRKQWLKAIGTENIGPNVKDIFICSSHFHEDAFNKTMGVIRLRDDAIPLQFPGKPSTGQDDSDLLTETNCRKENIPAQGPSTDHLYSSSLLPVKSEVGIIATDPLADTSSVKKLMQSGYVIIATDPVSGTSDVRKLMIPVKSTIPGTSGTPLTKIPVKSTISTIPTQPVAVTSGTPLTKDQTKIKELEQKCAILRKKVKTLNEKVRRQKRKIEEFENITKDSIVIIVPQESQDAPQIPVKVPVKKLHKILKRNKLKEQ